MEAEMKLILKDIVKTYGAHTALDRLSFELPGDCRCLALIGPSGGGKSTLLRHLGGLEAADSGLLEVNGQNLAAPEVVLRQFRRRNGFLFQGYNLFPHLTALQNIMLPLVEVHGHPPAAARQTAMAQLERFNLAEHGGKLPVQLSGGQQQRIALIRAIAASPELLFLDEPTAALDPEMTAEVLGLIRELIRGGQEVILCTHEMGFARAVADTIAYIAVGRVLESATPATFFSAPQNPKVQRFLSRVLEFR
jgi:polar amino acid transport system ATP-binding protein